MYWIHSFKIHLSQFLLFRSINSLNWLLRVTIINPCKRLNCSIWPIEGTLTGTEVTLTGTNLRSQNGFEIRCNEGVLYIPQTPELEPHHRMQFNDIPRIHYIYMCVCMCVCVCVWVCVCVVVVVVVVVDDDDDIASVFQFVSICILKMYKYPEVTRCI